MILLTKDNCPYCDWAISLLNGRRVQIVSVDSPEGMALAALYQTIMVPTLVFDDEAVFRGPEEIKKALNV